MMENYNIMEDIVSWLVSHLCHPNLFHIIQSQNTTEYGKFHATGCEITGSALL